MLEENEYSSGLSPISNTSFGSNSIILGFNMVNTLDRCIVLSV